VFAVTKTSLIDFVANIVPRSISVSKRVAHDGLVICRHAASANPGSWMGSAQVTLVVHEGAPFEIAWHPSERRQAEKHTVTSGQFHVTPAHEPVHVAWRGTQRSLTIALTDSFIRKAIDEPFDGKLPELRPRVALHDPETEKLVAALRRDMDLDDRYSRLCLDHVGAMLALRLFTTHGEGVKSLPVIRGGLGASCQRRLLDFIEAHLTEEIGLGQLAEEAGLSPYHFSKAFKTSLGVPPWRYVTERRIHRAKELLLDGCRSITEIAHDLGFSSHSHFTDVFRKTTGRAPSRFRRD
jgi:AraC family transcriptional regulator